MTEILFDRNYFLAEIETWDGFHNELFFATRSFDNLPPLPSLTRGFSPALDALIPALNDARADIVANLYKGQQAAEAIVNGLTEAGRAYGLTEDDAVRIADSLDIEE